MISRSFPMVLSQNEVQANVTARDSGMCYARNVNMDGLVPVSYLPADPLTYITDLPTYAQVL